MPVRGGGEMPEHFNPRTHVGCDQKSDKFRDSALISIHAPTWGATHTVLSRLSIRQFQSTHPRGVRLSFGIIAINRIHFNPRTHVGCDSALRLFTPVSAISIHAPTWGATLDRFGFKNWLSNFNPRTHVGCDMTLKYITLFKVNFNPRTHVGCDGVSVDEHTYFAISIHAPTWGATRDYAGMFDWTAISIHAPTWGATTTERNYRLGQ